MVPNGATAIGNESFCFPPKKNFKTNLMASNNKNCTEYILLLFLVILVKAQSNLEKVWYLGGSFNRTYNVLPNSTLQIVSTNNVAVWNGTIWKSMGSGANGPVFAISTDACQNVYIAGNFSYAGKNLTHAFAKWSTISVDWEPIFSVEAAPALFDGYVNTIAADCTQRTTNWPLCKCDIYIGGKFVLVDKTGTVARNIIKWNAWTSNWDFLDLANSTWLGNDEVLTVVKRSVGVEEVLDILWVGLAKKGLKMYNTRLSAYVFSHHD